MVAALPLHVGFALNTLPQQEAVAMMTGVRKYQLYDKQIDRQDLPVVWQSGQAAIKLCAAKNGKNAAPVLIVPSMINGAEILDLLPDFSFVRHLAARGIDVYIIDWGKPIDDADMRIMPDLVRGRLLPALNFVVQRTQQNPHLIGYCMGGTLATIAASLQAHMLRSLTLIAAPWDFHAGPVATFVEHGRLAAKEMIAAEGRLPNRWIQNVFAAVDPLHVAKKFSNFATMKDDSREENIFVAVEDWLSSGADLPDGIATTCIEEWYGQNDLAAERWAVGDDVIRLESITCPTLLVTARKDRLVPPESSIALTKTLPSVDVFLPDCGHIGLMAGRQAETQVWKPVATWLKKI
jgi:polyhydroxyalkanoate synthase